MSKQNKVNKSNYNQAGRLTPDDLARERQKQSEVSARAKGKERMAAKAPTVEPSPAQDRLNRRSGGEQAPSPPRTGHEE